MLGYFFVNATQAKVFVQIECSIQGRSVWGELDPKPQI